ncbi:MAG: 16S rRNA (cytosine(1402)-N(4))-methyltransferase RsmH [Clostridia bacterium]|nr:16S rRNA (cytosine(1402)-N(4))-methyltransferase RsmH [Clostridia bacterium]
MEFNHYSVMKQECIDGLNIKEDGIYLDCTVGGAGHSYEIAKKLKNGKLLCLDKDTIALNTSKERLQEFKNVLFYHCDFKNFKEAMEFYNIEKFDGILIDLGVSSYQIDTVERGFSYMHNAPLDMRMNQEQLFSAYDLINKWSEADLSQIFYEYGEERFSRQIAKNIVLKRKEKPIETTFELVEIIEKSVPAKFRFSGGHPAKRVFQALRIEVNDELEGLYDCLVNLARSLNKGGRMAVLSFHSLEDRAVKQAFNMLSSDCLCDKKLPICVCNHKAEIKLINKKPIIATEEELKQNSRSHSAKLRVIEKI